MQESILNIYLPYRPSIGNSNGKNCTYRCGLDDRTEGLTKVNTRLLVKALSDEACFETLNGAIGTALDAEDPFTTDNIPCGLG